MTIHVSEELAAGREIIDAWCTRYANGMPPVTARDALVTELLALRSAASPVEVKGLPWVSDGISWQAIPQHFIQYDITVGSVDGSSLYTLAVSFGGMTCHRTTHSTLDEAKAAAQADYATRIRSALSASPVATDRASQNQQGGVSEEDVGYLVWSNEHRAWWRAGSQGYSRSILGAGIYSRAEALEIARTARDGWDVDRAPDEIAVALADIPAPIRAAFLKGRQ